MYEIAPSALNDVRSDGVKLRSVSLDDKYVTPEGFVFLTGVQALVRLPMLQLALDRAAGLNTAGLVTGYAGSPLASYDIQVRQAASILKDAGVEFQSAVNEDLAMTAVWGSQQGEARGDSRYEGVFALWYGKGAGLDRSGDAMRHGNLAGSSPKGGVLLLLGDDHRAESSSVTHNAEYTMVDFMMPLLNPANVADLLEFGLFGIAMSRFSGSWVGLKCLHDVVESAEVIEISSRSRNFVLPHDVVPPEGGLNLRYPDNPIAQEARLHNYRIHALRAFARANAIDKSLWRTPDSRFGIISTGKTYLDVMQALEDLGIDAAKAKELGLALYKVGMSWPLETQGAQSFVSGLEKVMIVEEKRSLIEAQLKDHLFSQRQRPMIIGKTDEDGRQVFQSTGVLTSNQIAREIGRYLLNASQGESVSARLARIEQLEAPRALPLVALDRKPAFCSGCPHNRSTVVPAGSRGGAGTGCNYMVMWMDRGSVGYTQMGADGVNWIGEAPFSRRKHVFQNLGDGTYAHSGLLAIRATVAAGVNITFKILYNGVVAMTGGQPHDGAMTLPRIAEQVLAEGVKRVVVVTDDLERHPVSTLPRTVTVRHRTELDQVQRDLREVAGVTVLIYDQMCATEKRRLRKRGRLEDPQKRAFINHLVCEGCGDCSAKSSCVSVVPRETTWGRKRAIDQNSCNKDYSCVEGFCPSFVTIEDTGLVKGRASAQLDASALPEPRLPAIAGQYNIVLSGVGGTGVITLAAMLGMAAHLESKGTSTLDMMGLAQKGGTVTSHVRIARKPGEVGTARVPGASADVVIGCDSLALVSHEPMSVIGARTSVFVNTHEVMPGDFARHPNLVFPSAMIRRRLEAVASTGRINYLDATALALEHVGDSMYANIFLLGFAFQKGTIPLSAAAIERALELNGVQVEANKQAFRAGRRAAVDETIALEAPAKAEPTLQELVRDRVEFLTAYEDEAYAHRYQTVVQEVRAAETQCVPGSMKLALAVAQSLSRLMAYKDEYEVARLYTSGEFEADLRRQFQDGGKLRFHLAPPLLARKDPVSGEPRKMSFGPWVFHLFKILVKLRGLRGGPFDIFGHTTERRMERNLIEEYEDLIRRLLRDLDPGNHALAVEIARLHDDIRGYGHIKQQAISRVKAREAELLVQFTAAKLAATRVTPLIKRKKGMREGRGQ